METPKTVQPPLSNLQRELLGIFAKEVPEKDLIAIRGLLARYFAEKAMDLADDFWDSKGWSDEKADQILETKLRTLDKDTNL
ncbi:hypothetical protein ADIS_3759 [Lunatimonas lonarensis]|uniref:Uncharacterized protein n=1 Tax=Lunatimonas lonarensis TaxID=1232681 RepID=R7ZP81_9BACT|nr:hypothetical protein [Lunatimonas lonarensis]EON75868.1 hypothetical protein ADIS_3759 [Lunatimonas lonarensis]